VAQPASTSIDGMPASLPAATILADRRVAIGLAVAGAIGAGLLSSVIAPRGPSTTTNTLALMALALLVGVTGGYLARTRWILVPMAVAVLIGVELGRMDVVGATLDIRLDSAYGIIALVITRGVHGLLTVVPMAFGVLLGIGLARRSFTAPGATSGGRPVGTALVGLGTLGLVLLVAWPASTPPVLDPDGRAIPGSLNELSTVDLGGTEQTIMIRAADPDAPVLLYLSGGPGQSDLAFSRVFSQGWVQDFVVVDLDQRGNGRSYAAIDPVEAFTLDRAVADVVELADILRERFDEERIYVMGESWGTILGVLAVQERPDLFHAFIGSGQMVDIVDTDRRVYADLVAYAEGAGDADLAASLAAIGEPPYRDMPWANANLLTWYDYLYEPYTPSASYIARGEAAGLDPFGALGSEYAFIDKLNVLRGLIDTFAIVYPQLYDLDLRETATRLEVPVYVLDGAAELDGRRDLALEWFAMLDAPSKQLVTYEGAAHSVAFEQADAVQALLLETIVPATYGR
jgi:proline iminopeptidase